MDDILQPLRQYFGYESYRPGKGSANLQDYVHGFSLQQAKHNQELELLSIRHKYEFSYTFTDGRIVPISALCHHWLSAIANGTAVVRSSVFWRETGMSDGLSVRRSTQCLPFGLLVYLLF